MVGSTHPTMKARHANEDHAAISNGPTMRARHAAETGGGSYKEEGQGTSTSKTLRDFYRGGEYVNKLEDDDDDDDEGLFPNRAAVPSALDIFEQMTPAVNMPPSAMSMHSSPRSERRGKRGAGQNKQGQRKGGGGGGGRSRKSRAADNKEDTDEDDNAEVVALAEAMELNRKLRAALAGGAGAGAGEGDQHPLPPGGQRQQQQPPPPKPHDQRQHQQQEARRNTRVVSPVAAARVSSSPDKHVRGRRDSSPPLLRQGGGDVPRSGVRGVRGLRKDPLRSESAPTVPTSGGGGGGGVEKRKGGGGVSGLPLLPSPSSLPTMTRKQRPANEAWQQEQQQRARPDLSPVRSDKEKRGKKRAEERTRERKADGRSANHSTDGRQQPGKLRFDDEDEGKKGGRPIGEPLAGRRGRGQCRGER